MSSKITKIVKLSEQKNHPVILENFETYLEHRQHDMKCLLAQDRSLSAVKEDVGNVLLVTGEKEMYYGHVKVTSDETEQTDLMHTFVARRNRATGKMRLFEVRTSTLKHICHDRPQIDQPTGETDERRLLSLQRKFNPRAVYKQEQMRNNRLDLAVMEDKLQSLMAETVVKDVVDSSTPKTTSYNDALQQELYAKCNPDAKSLATLYDAQKVIGADVWRSLTAPAQQLLQIPVEFLSMANGYIENKVKAVMQSSEPTAEPNLAIVRTCIYMDVLAKLAGRKAYFLIKKVENVSPFTNVLDAPFRQHFLQRVQGISKTSDQVTKYTRNKALMYYMALVFALEESDAVNLSLLQQSLEVPRNEIIMYGTMVGARHNGRQDYFTIGKKQPKAEEDQLNDVLEMLKGTKRFRRN